MDTDDSIKRYLSSRRSLHRHQTPFPERFTPRHGAFHHVRGQHHAPRLLGDDCLDHTEQTYLYHQARGKGESNLVDTLARMVIHSALLL